MRRRLVSGWVTVISTSLFLILTAGNTQAAETRRERHVEIPAETVIAGDLVIDAVTAKVFGEIDGDLTVRSAFLNQVGTVTGDMTIAAGRAELRGTVGGSVRVAGGSVSLYGTIDGDVEFSGGQLTLVEGSHVAGTVTVHGGTLTVVATARIDGNLRGQVADATIEGEIARDVNLTVRRLTIAPGAKINGNLTYESRVVARIDPTAVVAGQISRSDPGDRVPGGALFLWHDSALPRLLMMMILGALLLLLRPRWMTEIADVPRRAPVATVMAGIGTAIMVPLLLIVLAILMITVPLAIIGGVVYVTIAYLSMAFVGLALGRVILRRASGDRRRPMNLLALVMGCSFLAMIRLLPIPYLDVSIAVVIALVGFGSYIGRRLGLGEERQQVTEPHAVFSLGAGGVITGTATALALIAMGTAIVGFVAALATVSQSAVFVWTIPPRQFGLAALVFAGTALMLAVAGIVLVRWLGEPRRKS